jgi:hypothetical protein
MGASSKSDLRPSQHLPGYGGGGAVLLMMKSLHGISPIMDGRHSFGWGIGGVGGVGGPNIGDRNGGHQQKDCALFGGCTPVVGGSVLAAAEGCDMAAIRTVARKKTRWHLDGAIAITLSVCLRDVNGLNNLGW